MSCGRVGVGAGMGDHGMARVCARAYMHPHACACVQAFVGAVIVVGGCGRYSILGVEGIAAKMLLQRVSCGELR